MTKTSHPNKGAVKSAGSISQDTAKNGLKNDCNTSGGYSSLSSAIKALLGIPKSDSRVTKDKPCPVCGKPDWCLYSPSFGVAICQRVESSRRAGDAGFVHVIDSDVMASLPPDYIPTGKGKKELQRGEDALLHTVYTALLDTLALSKEHRSNLLSRGLSDEVIVYNGYSSLPQDGRGAIGQKLLALVKDGTLPRLRTVPGFYVDDSNGDRIPGLAGNAGMLIPVRDVDGLIVGFQIRSDNPAGRKYAWLSSAGRLFGCSPGSPVHVAQPDDLKTANVVFITEGILKADIAAYYLGCVVIGLPGVNAYRHAVSVIAKLMPRNVVMAYDNDKRTNEQVKYYARQLEKELVRNHLNVYEAVWSSAYKGIDDYLVTGGKIQLRKIAVITSGGQYQYLDKPLQGIAIQEKTYQAAPYKEQEAKSHNYEWSYLNDLRAKATHIIAPRYLPPFSFPDCDCEYCDGVNIWQKEAIFRAVGGLA